MLTLPHEFIELLPQLGFARCAVASAQPVGQPGPWGVDTNELRHVADDHFQQWLSSGKSGQMGFLERHAAQKMWPDRQMPGAKSVIMLAFAYAQPAKPQAKGARIAQYALGRDYHKVLPPKLRTLCEVLDQKTQGSTSKAWTDAHPLHERYFAHLSGLSFTGKNTLSIVPVWGSLVFLASIITTGDFEQGLAWEDGKQGGLRQNACPSSCARCSKVCPTGALDGQGHIDASRCISYLTIEHKGPVPLHLRHLTGEWLFGCDLCQDVCPFNLGSPQTAEKDFLLHRVPAQLDLANILAMRSHEQFAERFAGSPLMRAGREGIVRNAASVAANTRAYHLIPALKDALENDTSAVVKEHAAWALEQLRDGNLY